MGQASVERHAKTRCDIRLEFANGEKKLFEDKDYYYQGDDIVVFDKKTLDIVFQCPQDSISHSSFFYPSYSNWRSHGFQ